MFNWSDLWISMFGTTMAGGVDIGFWVSMGVSLLIAIIMNIVFWSFKPKKVNEEDANQNKK